MLDRRLRQIKDRVLDPTAQAIGHRIHPTTISVVGFCVGMGAVAAAASGAYALGLTLWLLNRALDGLDGAVARASAQQTDLGGYLDLLFDFGVYALVPLGLALHVNASAVWLALALLLSSFYVNAASWMLLSALLEKRARSTVSQTSVAMPGGLIEGTETILFYVSFYLLPGYLAVLYLLMASLVLLTVFQRGVWAAQALQSS